MFDHGRVWVAATRVFEHCEAAATPCSAETVTRSVRRVARLTLYWFDRYSEPVKRKPALQSGTGFLYTLS